MAHKIYQFRGGGGAGLVRWAGGLGDAGTFFESRLREEFARERILAQRQPARRTPVAAAITTSAELPGSTHYMPDPVPVGESGGGAPVIAAVIQAARGGLPGVAVQLPRPGNEPEPPIIFSPPPLVLPGQTDPGREERETEEGELAHTWTHVGSQLLGALFPGSATQQAFVAGPSTGFNLGGGGGAVTTTPPAAAVVGGSTMYAGSCPPAKTRTLTIDCATGLEVKRKRRRRRALLTQGDMGVLFQIASLPNSANVRVALAGAIRR